jgi:uncharacterized damage-inducible protein DinB
MKLRILLLLSCLMLLSGAVKAQSPNDDLKKGFNEVNDWVVKAADMVPADKYNYKPTDSVRTFGQLVAHIADSYNFFCARGVGNKVEWADPVEKGNTDKDTLMPKLKEAVGRCTAAYAANNAQFGPLFANVGHTSLHYGNIITYMRMLGLKPPSS